MWLAKSPDGLTQFKLFAHLIPPKNEEEITNLINSPEFQKACQIVLCCQQEFTKH